MMACSGVRYNRARHDAWWKFVNKPAIASTYYKLRDQANLN